MSTVSEKKDVMTNPFPGLRPFDINESHLFFGREGQTDEVLMKLSKHRFVGVIGPSGSGKSSFIFCGLLPIIYGGFLTSTGPNWEVVVARPGGSPIENLGEAIIQHDPVYQKSNDEDKKIKRTIISTLMKSSSLGLVEAIQQTKRSTDKNFLILIDQFEELFRFKKESVGKNDSLNETIAFINLLTEAVSYDDEPIYVALTMRSDFIGECAQFSELTKKINDSHYLIPMLTREQKRKAIEGPVAVGGGEIAPRLTQKLLNDLGDNPDQLPILQHALMRTWSYWSNNQEGEEAMDLKHYDAIGTMEEALSMHANEAYDELTEDQREICATLFRALTEKRGENFGIRRPTRLQEIADISGVTVKEVVEVIEKFRAPGRSLLTPNFEIALKPDSIIDISHESLMRIWVRLKNWVDDEAEAVTMYLRLAEASGMYQIGKAGLWRPPDLQLALNWQIKHKPTLIWGQRYDPAYERTMVFLEYSKNEFEEEQKIKELQAKRALRRARMTALVMGAATIVCIFFLIFAFIQKTVAETARIEADTNLVEAEKQRNLADENANEAKTNLGIAEKEKATADSARSEADISAQTAITAQSLAEDRQKEAEEATTRAVSAEGEALTSAELAEKRAEEARLSAEEAKRQEANARLLRFQSLSKNLAITATKNHADDDLKGLLAMQGYNYNRDYEGPVFNADVYDGLYKALKKFDDKTTRNLEGHSKQVSAITAGLGDQFLFSGDSEGKIVKWTMLENEIIAEQLTEANSGKHIIKDIDISSDKSWLAVGGDYPDRADGTSYMQLIDLTSNRVMRIGNIKGTINSIEFIPNSDEFLILQENGASIAICDALTKDISNFIVPASKLFQISLSGDGRYLSGASEDGILRVWDLENNFTEKEFLTGEFSLLSSVQFSPDGTILVAGELSGGVTLINTKTGGIIRKFSEIQSKIVDVEFSPNGKYMAAASLDKTIRIWNMEELKDQPLVLQLDGGWSASISFSSDSEFLLGGGFKDGEVRVWPMDITRMSDRLCGHISRNMTEQEWEIYVADLDDIAYEKTCENHN